MHFYIYRLDHLDTGEFYLGSRKCKCLPIDDIGYMGSMIKWKPDKTRLVKTVIYTEFETYEHLLLTETEIIKANKTNPLNRNYSVPQYNFHLIRSEDVTGEKNGFYGKHHSEEHKQKVSEKLMGENNPSFGKKWMNRDNVQKYVGSGEIEHYIADGWAFGCLFLKKENNPYSKKRTWLTNGIENRYVVDELIDEILQLEGWRKGKTYSDDTKLKFKTQLLKSRNSNSESVSKRLSGTIFINNGSINLRILPDEAESYLEKGWKRGRWQKAWNSKS